MRSILISSVLALAACEQDRDGTNEQQVDRTNAASDRTVPPGSPADAAHPMGRPDMPHEGRPPVGRGDMGRGEGRDNFRVDPSDPNSAPVEELVATVSGGPKHKNIQGVVTFRMQGGNTLVDAKVDGLPKGEHGYHVHVFGDCSALDAKSPGEHLDFHAGMGGMGGPPGSNMPPSTTGGAVGTLAGTGTGTGIGTGSGSGVPKSLHTTATDMAGTDGTHVMGNLGELQPDASGHAAASRTVDARLRQLLGRAVVIHEKGNDETKPDGAAGDPIACGVIGIANPAAKASAAKEPDPK
jgi:Cu/Zn superoxide dismutase